MSTFKLQRGEPLLDISSFAKRGPGRTDRLTPTEIEHIARTVRRDPEVMVKVSGGGASPKAVAAHFKYIDRRGELDIETDDGARPNAGHCLHNSRSVASACAAGITDTLSLA